MSPTSSSITKYVFLLIGVVLTALLIATPSYALSSETIDIVDSSNVVTYTLNEPFTRFLVSLETKQQQTDLSFDYRSLSSTNQWSEWNSYSISLPNEHRIDDNYDAMSTPYILVSDPSTSLQLRSFDSQGIVAQIHLLDDSGQAPYSVAATGETYQINDVSIVSRAGWGCHDGDGGNDPNSDYYCDGPYWTPSYFPVSHIIVHHTATSNNATDWAAEVRAIWYYHSHVNDLDPNDEVQGWTDIGYNYLIDPNGVIYEGRYGGEGVTAGHAKLHNQGTVGISMLGTYTSQGVTDAARASLTKLTTTLATRYRIQLDEMAWDIGGAYVNRLSGHRDWNPTGCPGDGLYPLLTGDIRDATSYQTKLDTLRATKSDPCPTGYTLYDGSCHKYSLTAAWAGAALWTDELTIDIDSSILNSSYSEGTLVRTLTDGSTEQLVDLSFGWDSMASRADGRIYINDFTNDQVIEIATDNSTSTFAAAGDGPYDLEFDSNGNLLVTNLWSEDVTKITPAGSSSTLADVGSLPLSITIDSNDTAYVANNTGNSVTKISSDGSTVSTIDTTGLLPVEIVADGSNNVYTADELTSTITKISTSEAASRFAGINSHPNALAIDQLGNLYTSHEWANAISKVTPDGYVDNIYGTGNGPVDIGVGSDGTVYTANNGWSNLSKLTIEAESVPVTAPVSRFWSDQGQAHFYTASTAERDHVFLTYFREIWKYEDVGFYVHTNQPANSAPVYRFYSDAGQAHFYTISESERDYVLANYPEHWNHYEGVVFYAYKSDQGDTDPVHRFWSESKQVHFYTISESEKNYVIANYPSIWQYEGVAFYAFD